ncbi:hypothetical protein UR09_06170 [Candidatus Nitromaritima sp. SCGC AAA799-A02]|nr:hypothetical protein UR09_06170 [Candidatus Nitromaritima sp. SCGC AAA799-A02]KMP11814.1 hypothetical protein UZ36_03050 [Candidatus Nitromaritima sp. SCGC AAA799-C22]
MADRKYRIGFPGRALLAGLFLFFVSAEPVLAQANTFHQLILEKQSLEIRFGVKTVECFPFMENIGFTEDQIPLITNCLSGARLLTEALSRVPDAEIHTVGISTRFLRTAGFNTILFPWNAPLKGVVEFLKNKTPKAEQDRFLKQISSLKSKIKLNFRIPSLYCSQRISNSQCMMGYERMAAMDPPGSKSVTWQETIVDDRQGLGRDSHSLRIRFDASSAEMRELLLRDPNTVWSSRKKMYEDIRSRYQGTFEKRLQIGSYHCSTDLTEENCMEGITNLFEASKDQILRMKAWGEVEITRYNTFIKGDYDVSIRFDLPPDEIVRYFASKANRAEGTEHAVQAEKLEKRTLNNSSGLRAVCDLEGLHSRLCLSGFEKFIGFVSARRDYRVKEPWTEVMFIDGTRLARVNFALNSPVRHSYIYVDAGSDPEEFGARLMRLAEDKTSPEGQP